MSYLTAYTSLSPIQRGFVPGFVNYKKGCIRGIKFTSCLPMVGGSLWVLRLILPLKLVGPKKNLCVFTVTCQKNLGSVGIIIFFF